MAKAAKRDPRALVHEVFTTECSHMSLDEVVADFPVALINAKTRGLGVGLGVNDDVVPFEPLVGACRAKDVSVIVNHRDLHGPSLPLGVLDGTLAATRKGVRRR